MTENGSLSLRKQDIAHRTLHTAQGSQPSVGYPEGDSPNLPDVYYVDSGNGNDNEDGRDPGFPLATIDAAVNKCTASQGDVILVQPGHAETLATQISLDVIGVSIIGIGEGTLRPQLTIAAAIDGIDIGAANCSVENIGFAVSTAGALSQINIDAADATVRGVHFACGASDLLGTITITASGEVATIEDCTVIVTADGPDEWILIEGVVDRTLIQRNFVVGSDGTNAFDVAIINADAVAATNTTVIDNNFSGGGVAVTAVVGTGLVGTAEADNNYHSGATAGSSGFVEGLGFRVTKQGARTSGAASDDLFDVTGLCLITLFFGEVTTEIGTNSDLVLNMKASSGLDLATLTVLDGDVVQTLYALPEVSGALLVLGTNGAYVPSTGKLVVNTDTIEATWTEIGTTGSVLWTLYYTPLESGANIVASA